MHRTRQMERRAPQIIVKPSLEPRRRYSLMAVVPGEASERSHSASFVSQPVALLRNPLGPFGAEVARNVFCKVPGLPLSYWLDGCEVGDRNVQVRRFEVAGKRLRAPPSFR